MLGEQHGTNNKRSMRVVAKSGYAVAGITVKSMLMVEGFRSPSPATTATR